MYIFSFFKKRKRQKKKRQPSPVFVYAGVLFVVVTLGVVYHYVKAYVNQDKPIEVVVDSNFGIRLKVIQFFEDNDATEMIPIIKCESQFRQYEPDGTVLRNKEGSSAIGVAQILSSVHPDPKIIERYNKSFNMNMSVEDFDITTLNGNMGYALVLYQVRGTRDWECAKKFRF